MTSVLTSAAGIIALLDEQQHELKSYALKKLDQVVNEFWPEIADYITKIEILQEAESPLPQRDRQLASLILSKVYYHLGSFGEALEFALAAGPLFDLSQRNEYIETILAKCLDRYIHLRLDKTTENSIDPRLGTIVDRMFEQCFKDKQYKQALGVALETRRMDMFGSAIMNSGNETEMLAYAFRVAMTLIGERGWRDEILKSLIGIYAGLPSPDYVSMCQCLIYLDNPEEAALVIEKLSSRGAESQLMAYQIGFDLYESATQNFLARVLAILKRNQAAFLPQPVAAVVATPAAPTEAEGADQPMPPAATDDISTAETQVIAPEGEATTTATPTPPAVVAATAAPPKVAVSDEMKKHWEQMIKILGGEVTIALQLQFLVRSNKSDLMILKQTKDSVRVSICHTATVIANSFMHSGTTSDQFLRENLDWLARATNWAKFTATGSLGVIHRGHETEARSLMQSYLPRDGGAATSGYSEGGALYALGIIHANHGGGIIDYLLTQLKDAPNEMIRHGGCLGLGLAAMGLGTVRQDVYEILKNNLYQDDAVTGEAAGIAMGLTMLGSMNETAVTDMIAYARETQHEKILRGLALGISFLCFGKLEGADALITTLLSDKDSLLRRAGVFCVAMAYCGTAANSAIQTLLKVAVSDVNDDVRRAAVIGLGFLLFRTPEQCPSVVSLLTESYNPHVRYGAAMAIGIACAGTGSKDAISLIEPLTQDSVNYVRQGALLASAMVLIQQTEVTCPKVKEFRALYTKVLNDKHDDVMAKFGAILAQGIIDGGGRNVTVSLSSRTGHVWLQGAVGMLLFTHYWYWFPMSLSLGLAFAPTCIVAVNKSLEMPVLEYKSNIKPSTFAYPPPLEVAKKEEKERVATAILSVTAKAKRREAEKDSTPATKLSTSAKEEPMEVDVAPVETAKEKKKEDKKEGEDVVKTESAEKIVIEVKKEEPTFELLKNPARVMKQQLRFMEMTGKRFKAIKDITSGGIILVKDSNPTDPVELVQPVAACGPKKEEEEDEPSPPEPFEYNDIED
ncbi:26S proteasome non-ATPase regulatory subunit 1 [Folsomia candida]|uniref:26S proteasome non-ATPase regulatory subunit 1 n=1 Tax=Folsomia candida TaxID=158441 RepID=UPI000B90780A|nr:26S proteasome non-ATPase regulatory subunit 1 [Folsomia candida]